MLKNAACLHCYAPNPNDIAFFTWLLYFSNQTLNYINKLFIVPGNCN